MRIFKNHLSEYLAAVQSGEDLEIRKRNTPLARVVPIPFPQRNHLGDEVMKVFRV